MTGILRGGRMPAALLSVALILVTFGGLGASAHERYYGGHHSRGRGALIGGTVGLVGGGLLGGGRGAVIGAGAGAGTGYLIQRSRNNWRYHHYRRHNRYFRHNRYWRR